MTRVIHVFEMSTNKISQGWRSVTRVRICTHVISVLMSCLVLPWFPPASAVKITRGQLTIRINFTPYLNVQHSPLWCKVTPYFRFSFFLFFCFHNNGHLQEDKNESPHRPILCESDWLKNRSRFLKNVSIASSALDSSFYFSFVTVCKQIWYHVASTCSFVTVCNKIDNQCA